MPATEEAYRLTDGYAAAMANLRARMGRFVRTTWPMVTREDLDGTFNAFSQSLISAIAAGQRTGIAYTDNYFTRFLSAELAREIDSPELDQSRFEGEDEFGRDLARALRPAVLRVKMALAEKRLPNEALGIGLANVGPIAAAAVIFPGRRALSELVLSDSRVLGYRRATSLNPCGACLALATGETMASDVDFKLHRFCRCVTEPVLAGTDPDAVRRPSGPELFAAMTAEQQDDLFAGRGGADKAELLRSGAIDFDHLVTTQPQAIGPDIVTETPLAALTQR